VLAESFERIHRSNLIGMGVLPLEFLPGESRESHRLTGTESIDVTGLIEGITPRKRVSVRVTGDGGSTKSFQAVARIDTPEEVEYYRHGGILPYVLRNML